MRFSCVSVPGGWQTEITTKDSSQCLIGPVYNRVTDLWAWQRENLYCEQAYFG